MSVCVGGRVGEKAESQKAEELNQHERTEGASPCKLSSFPTPSFVTVPSDCSVRFFCT